MTDTRPMTVGELLEMSSEDRHAAIHAMGSGPPKEFKDPNDWPDEFYVAMGKEIDRHPIRSPDR